MTRVRSLMLILGATLTASGGSVVAADRNPPAVKRVDLFDKLVSCRAIADPQQRLACFDANVDALDQAEKSNQVVIMDRSQVREARRSLFGFSLPKLKLFGGDGDKDQIDHIDTTVSSITRDVNGAIIFTTPEGARWHQLDDRAPFGVRTGTKVTIQRASLGSYFAKFAGTTAIRVKREN